jgi:hypothetical protein
MKKYIYIIALTLSLVILPKVILADTLAVTSISAIKTSATANNSYTDGWKWIFNITVPAGEDRLQMKFTDWTNGVTTIPVSDNMRIYSTQSTNASTTASAITLTSANTYGDEMILDSALGQNIQVEVEIKVPSGTTGGSYSTTYGIFTSGTSTPVVEIGSITNIDWNNEDQEIIYGEENVNLSGFELIARDQDSILNSLTVQINNDQGVDSNTLLSNVRIMSNNDTYYTATATSSDGTFLFDNLNLSLEKNHLNFFEIVADCIDGTPGIFSVTATVLADMINATDANSNPSITDEIDDIIGGEITFTPWLLEGGRDGYRVINLDSVVYHFELSNYSESDLYIAKNSSSGILSSPNSGGHYDDTDTAYHIPEDEDRNFTITSSSTPATSITINYGPDIADPTVLTKVITY